MSPDVDPTPKLPGIVSTELVIAGEHNFPAFQCTMTAGKVVYIAYCGYDYEKKRSTKIGLLSLLSFQKMFSNIHLIRNVKNCPELSSKLTTLFNLADHHEAIALEGDFVKDLDGVITNLIGLTGFVDYLDTSFVRANKND